MLLALNMIWRRDLNGEEVWISKSLITYYFNVLSRHSYEDWENNKTLDSSVSQLRYEPVSPEQKSSGFLLHSPREIFSF
jgi:hypothetical protein